MVEKKKTRKTKTKKANNKGTSALKEIIKIAQDIRKKSPAKQWKTCISEASKKYKNKK